MSAPRVKYPYRVVWTFAGEPEVTNHLDVDAPDAMTALVFSLNYLTTEHGLKSEEMSIREVYLR